MADALIGCTGFVGTTLLRQRSFDLQYHSKNIGEIVGNSFDLVACAGAPAQKWIANREPDTDRRKIEGLIEYLKTVRCDVFILISTVDVFKDPAGVHEDSPIDESGLHAYGLHRRLLEKFVEDHFPNHLVVRLPGLVGPGLRKNVVFDFLNDNGRDAIDSRGVFQFYPTVNLWFDIHTALRHKLTRVHLTAEPISVAEVSAEGFGVPFNQTLSGPAAAYDMRTRFASAFGGSDRLPYQYRKREAIQAIRTYAQSEPRTLKAALGKSA